MVNVIQHKDKCFQIKLLNVNYMLGCLSRVSYHYMLYFFEWNLFKEEKKFHSNKEIFADSLHNFRC